MIWYEAPLAATAAAASAVVAGALAGKQATAVLTWKLEIHGTPCTSHVDAWVVAMRQPAG